MKYLIAGLVVIGACILVSLITFGITFGVIFIGNFVCEWLMGTELLTVAQVAAVSVIVVLLKILFFNHKK